MKVAEAVAREYENGNADQGQSSQDDLFQDELPLVDEQDVIANRFAIKNNRDLEKILDALETYCLNTDSDNLPQVFKNEKIQPAAAQQRRLKQSTLDAFVMVE